MDNEYYDLLQVPRTATKEEIKKAYKVIARKHHPDKGGDPEKFKKINEAYGVLSDDQLRSQYDQFGKTGAGEHHFPDFFNMMFPFPMGMMNQQHPLSKKKTPNRTMDLELTMEESFHGATIKFRYKRKVWKESSDTTTCLKCHGNGKVMEQIRAPIGIIQNVTICSSCAGVGVSVSEDQFQTVIEIVDLHIPPYSGIGKQIILHGKSDEMPTMETGDLILTIVMKKHEHFQLIGTRDILWNVLVHPLEALTSFYRSISLPSGEMFSLEHQPNDQFFKHLHQKRIIQGKGLFDGHGERGNLLILFTLKEYYVSREIVEKTFSVPLPVLKSGGLLLKDLPLYQEEKHEPKSPFRQQQQQPHVQECRPS
jgi:DnaJ family protein A protein 2